MSRFVCLIKHLSFVSPREGEASPLDGASRVHHSSSSDRAFIVEEPCITPRQLKIMSHYHLLEHSRRVRGFSKQKGQCTDPQEEERIMVEAIEKDDQT